MKASRVAEAAGSVVGMAVGSLSGAKIGKGIGIVAGRLGGCAGTIPCSIAIGAIGLLLGNKVGSEVDRASITK